MNPDLRRGFLRRAVAQQAPLLATLLDRYCRQHATTWEAVAASLGCSLATLEHIAMCGLPRAESWQTDVDAIADGRVDPTHLGDLLARL